MAISSSQLVWTDTGGNAIPNSAHAVFPAGRVGDGFLYRWCELRNRSALTLSTVKMWTSQDARGGAFAVALGSTTTLANSVSFGLPDPTSLAYTEATTKAAGLTLPDIAGGSKVLVALRRTLVGASTAYPEVNRVIVGGTSPI